MSTGKFGPSSIAPRVYAEHLDQFGEPDNCIVFDDKPMLSGEGAQIPSRIEVYAWHPTPDLDITTFATIGMSDKPMTGAKHRAELHFAVRKTLSEEEQHACSLFLANLATYPFQDNTSLDWWHTIQDPGNIPQFPNARSVLLYPRFVEDGWEEIHVDGLVVKILNVIPISAAAYQLESTDQMMAYMWDELGDPFAPW